MSVVIRIDLGKVPDLLKKLDNLRGYKKGLQAAGYQIQGEMRKYPPVSRRPMIFKSAKHRRGFFGLLKAGKIEVPYIRSMSKSSERLGARWAVATSNNGLTVQIGNNATYANLVQGNNQAQYHKKTGWKTMTEVANANEGKVQRIIERYVQDDLRV